MRVIDALGPLCEPLHDTLTEARARAHQRLPELVEDPALASALTHATRGLALHGLRRRDLGPWRLVPQNNVGIALSNTTYSVRVLHQLPDRSAPPPGPNMVRRRFYRNETLDAEIFPTGDRLLALWGVDRKNELAIRIVRPIGLWNFGRREKVDLDFMLPAVAEDLDALIYDTSDDDIVVTIPGEEARPDDERKIGS